MRKPLVEAAERRAGARSAPRASRRRSSSRRSPCAGPRPRTGSLRAKVPTGWPSTTKRASVVIRSRSGRASASAASASSRRGWKRSSASRIAMKSPLAAATPALRAEAPPPLALLTSLIRSLERRQRRREIVGRAVVDDDHLVRGVGLGERRLDRVARSCRPLGRRGSRSRRSAGPRSARPGRPAAGREPAREVPAFAHAGSRQRVRQDDVAVGCRRLGIGRSPITPGSTSKKARRLQAVLDLALALEHDVDPVAARQQRQRVRSRTRSAARARRRGRRSGAETSLSKRRDRLAEAVDDRQLALHHRQHLGHLDHDRRRAPGDDGVGVAAARVADLQPPRSGVSS